MILYEKDPGEVRELSKQLDKLGFSVRNLFEDRWGYTLRCEGNGQVIMVGAQDLVKVYRYAVEKAIGKSEEKP
jgi:hypothetical protein